MEQDLDKVTGVEMRRKQEIQGRKVSAKHLEGGGRGKQGKQYGNGL